MHELEAQVPSVGLHPSFRLAALLALEDAELIHQVDERLRHAPGPPARVTATFSPGRSIERDYPPVKGAADYSGLWIHVRLRVLWIHLS
jgi:hypothetical protein